MSGSASGQEQDSALPALQVVVLVDESGSLGEPDVAREKEAARTIVYSALAPGSVISVVGFGSSNGPGQSAVQVACPPTALDSAQQRDSLAGCIGGLHRRAPAEGDGTDHATALQQALGFVGAAKPEKKLIFLLTDGKLDVSDSPAWGDTPARRNGAAAAKVQETLNDLDRAGAQVWPLGFGKVDNAALHGFAKGKSCTPSVADPHEQVTPSSAELTAAVQEAFSSASCVKYGPLDTGNVPKGGSVELTVEIPPVAGDASILVYKRDPRVQVEYLPPSGTTPAPRAGGSRFEFAGQNTETEALRITDPEPGRWTVRLSSADVPAQDVAATVAYQATVKAYLTVNPPQPAAGQPVDVTMQVWARNRAVTDAGTLQGLTFKTVVTGASGRPLGDVTLSDPDRDGTFTGQVGLPADATGALTFTGTVTGVGIGGDTRVLSTSVQNGPAPVQAQILFDTNTAAVNPGGTVTGTIAMTNNSGRPVPARLEIASPTAGASISVEPGSAVVPVGVTTIPFTLRFGADTVEGSNAATLRVVTDGAAPVTVAERLFATDVEPEPTILEKLFWVWVALGIVLAGLLVFAVMKVRARRSAGQVRDLQVQLLKGDTEISAIEPQDGAAAEFAFVIYQDFPARQLNPAGPGDAEVYRVRRAGPNVRLAPPRGEPVVLTPGQRHELGDEHVLVVLDQRVSGVVGSPVVDSGFSPFGGASTTGGMPPSDTRSYADPFADPAGPGVPAPVSSASGGFAGPGGHDAATGGDPFSDQPFGGVPPAGGGSYHDPSNPFATD
ncbi:vWA domain-containing protein [Amycolatopsis sp. NBRC 101858]|uniref:vWA domain-containing protein n=1 Tax=Amycolatopsis sp. NBRC 101858 TaxID=3032200 RepID=UPI00255261B4|nr:vWA domain-containing protein [Amycolatopsis sp. NBRC 101858]